MVLYTLGFGQACQASTALEEKLDHQFDRYAKAQAKLRQRWCAACEQGVSRGEWEAWLAGSGDDELTPADLAELRSLQRERIAAAKAQAVAASTIDLGHLRAASAKDSTKVEQFCAALPKGGMLHIHPWATMQRATVTSLLQRKKVPLKLHDLATEYGDPKNSDYLYPPELRWLNHLGADAPFSAYGPLEQEGILDLFALPPGNHPFERFDAVFGFLDLAIANAADLETALFAFARDAKARHVSYVELHMGLDAKMVHALDDMLPRIEAETGLVIRVDRAFVRVLPPAALDESFQELKALLPSKWIVGIDLLANERHAPAFESAQNIYSKTLNETSLHRTMHAGELGDERNPRDAMLLGAERLGHGVLLVKDAVALEYAARHHIPVEINLISNLRLMAVDDLDHHPFVDYLRLGLPVSLSTDDEGVEATNIDIECVAAIQHSDITYAELKAMSYHSIATAFLREDEKASLRQNLDEMFAAFEQKAWVWP